MTIHATGRVEYAIARLLGYLSGLSLTGSPTLTYAEEPGREADAGPWVRVTFDEIDPIRDGRFSATQSAYRMALLVVCDIFWPDSDRQATPDLYGEVRAASELRDALAYLKLSFLDYSTPSSPVAVTDAALTIHQPVSVRRLEADAGFRRRRVQATVEWFARYDDFAA